eukprot:COSAG01_NODE_8086_length_2925_cov_12.218684_7_plen_61_part_01
MTTAASPPGAAFNEDGSGPPSASKAGKYTSETVTEQTMQIARNTPNSVKNTTVVASSSTTA